MVSATERFHCICHISVLEIKKRSLEKKKDLHWISSEKWMRATCKTNLTFYNYHGK